jgi:hypothetical protein
MEEARFQDTASDTQAVGWTTLLEEAQAGGRARSTAMLWTTTTSKSVARPRKILGVHPEKVNRKRNGKLATTLLE